MKDFKEKYYEQTELWAKELKDHPDERKRIEETISLIPPDVESILDVGCGNGWFVNSLHARYQRVVGLDSSRKALEHVQTEKAHGDISALPFKTESFDLSTCLEVIEHLPYETFIKGLSELERVSKKYIMVTVPNDEDLELSLVVCPQCHCRYNPSFHMRSFKHSVMKELFEQFRLIKCEEIGGYIYKPTYSRALLLAYFTWKKVSPPRTAICAQCGYQVKDEQNSSELLRKEQRDNFVKKILYLPKLVAKKTIWKPQKIKPWLMALYAKKAREDS